MSVSVPLPLCYDERKIEGVKTRTVYLKITTYSSLLLLASVCQDLNYVQVVFDKPLYRFCFVWWEGGGYSVLFWGGCVCF